jgi:hypothetical protein
VSLFAAGSEDVFDCGEDVVRNMLVSMSENEPTVKSKPLNL